METLIDLRKRIDNTLEHLNKSRPAGHRTTFHANGFTSPGLPDVAFREPTELMPPDHVRILAIWIIIAS